MAWSDPILRAYDAYFVDFAIRHGAPLLTLDRWLKHAARSLKVAVLEVYTCSEARQKLAHVLDEAESKGKVIIQRKDGRTFARVPEHRPGSPLDVPPIKADISMQEVVSIVRESRRRGIRH